MIHPGVPSFQTCYTGTSGKGQLHAFIYAYRAITFSPLIIDIGVGRFRILGGGGGGGGGARFRILGGPKFRILGGPRFRILGGAKV